MSHRVLIAVTHLLGTGHLSRASAIASGLGHAGFDVTLVSGGMPAPTIGAGAYRFVQLPPVRIVGTDYANLLDEAGAPVGGDRLAARTATLLATFRQTNPAAVIIEHFPFGRRQLAAELLALIDAARASRPRPYILSSIREVLVAPAQSERVAEVAQRIAALFDAVLVHGDETFLPLDTSWPTAAAGMAGKLIYTGYVGKPAAAAATEADSPLEAANGEIVVSGGGSAAALPLFKAAIGAAGLSAANWKWRILVGHGVSDDQFRNLLGLADAANVKANVVIERARRDFASLLARCAVSVSQAGYNTVIDVLHARRPAVLVPYEEDEVTDQTLRANAMANAGLCVVCDGETLSARTLLTAITAAISRGPPPRSTINIDGVAGTAKILERLLAHAPVSEISAGRHLG